MIKILDFYASWCVPCKTLHPVITQVKEKYPEIEIEAIDVDKNVELANAYRVMGLPSLVFLKDGNEVARLTNLVTMEDIEQKIKEVRNGK